MLEISKQPRFSETASSSCITSAASQSYSLNKVGSVMHQNAWDRGGQPHIESENLASVHEASTMQASRVK